jgi:hypothetical protein
VSFDECDENVSSWTSTAPPPEWFAEALDEEQGFAAPAIPRDMITGDLRSTGPAPNVPASGPAPRTSVIEETAVDLSKDPRSETG